MEDLEKLGVIFVTMLVVCGSIWKIAPKNQRGQYCFALFLVAIAALFGWMAIDLSPEGVGSTAGTIPKIWATLLGTSCFVLFPTLRRESFENNQIDTSSADLLRPTMAFAALFVYVFLLSYVGFYLATGLFFISVTLMIGYRRPAILVTTLVAWLVLVYLTFDRLLNIPLPVGSMFEALSTFHRFESFI